MSFPSRAHRATRSSDQAQASMSGTAEGSRPGCSARQVIVECPRPGEFLTGRYADVHIELRRQNGADRPVIEARQWPISSDSDPSPHPGVLHAYIVVLHALAETGEASPI